MFKQLRQSTGHIVIVQCPGFAVRGHLDLAGKAGLELVGASILDEQARSAQWQPMDGRVFIPAPHVQYVQVVS